MCMQMHPCNFTCRLHETMIFPNERCYNILDGLPSSKNLLKDIFFILWYVLYCNPCPRGLEMSLYGTINIMENIT